MLLYSNGVIMVVPKERLVIMVVLREHNVFSGGTVYKKFENHCPSEFTAVID